MCDKGFIWNPSNCECECNKSCDTGDYKNCMCRKKIIEKLIEECSKNIDENKILYNETLDNISPSGNKNLILVLYIWYYFLCF